MSLPIRFDVVYQSETPGEYRAFKWCDDPDCSCVSHTESITIDDCDDDAFTVIAEAAKDGTPALLFYQDSQWRMSPSAG